MHYSQPRKISLLQIPQYKKFLKCYYNYRIIFTGLGHKDSCISVCHICLLAYTILHLPVQPSVHLSIHLDAGTVDHRFCEANRGELSRNFSTFKEKSGSLTSITTAHHHPLYSAVLMYSTQHHHINLRPIFYGPIQAYVSQEVLFIQVSKNYKQRVLVTSRYMFPFLSSEAFLINLMELI